MTRLDLFSKLRAELIKPENSGPLRVIMATCQELGCHFDKSYWGPNGPDISQWNRSECGRGINYAAQGIPVASGTKGVIRKISTGRKHRGMASDNYHALETTSD